MGRIPKYRLGTTSYIIEDDLSVNALYLSSRVKEIELVLFEVTDGPTNLPDKKTQECLTQIGEKTGLVYTVHLPKDLSLRDGAESIMLTEKVLQLTSTLPVYGVVAHIEGWYWKKHKTSDEAPKLYREWLNEGQKLVRWLCEHVHEGWHVCVENVENTPADEVNLLLDGLGASRCVDVGHLLKDHYPDPLGYVEKNLANCRSIHLHAMNGDGRDHHSVALMDKDFLDQLLMSLVDRDYDGVLTLEVFGQADFQSSLQAIRESYERIGVEWVN